MVNVLLNELRAAVDKQEKAATRGVVTGKRDLGLADIAPFAGNRARAIDAKSGAEKETINPLPAFLAPRLAARKLTYVQRVAGSIKYVADLVGYEVIQHSVAYHLRKTFRIHTVTDPAHIAIPPHDTLGIIDIRVCVRACPECLILRIGRAQIHRDPTFPNVNVVRAADSPKPDLRPVPQIVDRSLFQVRAEDAHSSRPRSN